MIMIIFIILICVIWDYDCLFWWCVFFNCEFVIIVLFVFVVVVLVVFICGFV